MIDQTVREFLESLGLRGANIVPRQPFSLEAESIGRLTFLISGDKLLLGLTREEAPGSPAPGRLMAACHFLKGHPWPVQPQMRRGRYGFYIILDDSQATVKNTQMAFDSMVRAMQEASLN